MAKSGKTRKAIVKRFKKTANGKLKFHSPGKRHLATGKSRKRKRQLGKAKFATPGDVSRLTKAMGL